MLRNYFLIALRNISRNKLFSTLNILGLAFGMCSALLIFLWINDELQYDHFHVKIKQIYRVLENQQYSDGRLYTFNSTPAPMAPYIKEKYPEIEKATRLSWQVNNLFRYGNKSFYELGRYADQDFFDIFSFSLESGDRRTALQDKHAIVISRKMADKYFGSEEAVGKILVMGAQVNFTVTGVMNDFPRNSSFQADYLLPFQYFYDENKSWLGEWGNNNIQTFILLMDGTNNNFSEKFKSEVASHVEKTNVELFVQPFADAYLYGNFENGKQAGGRIEYVKIFFIVAVFVLVIACINFMNLATAQATKRAKEVGLRKVIGAVPSQLFRQFMGESFLTVTVAAVVAMGMTSVLIPLFNEITGKALGLNLLDIRIVVVFGIIVFVTAFLAGCYPALFISDFKPVQVLKGQLQRGRGATSFRKALVVLQFSLSIILIISTVVVFRQMSYMQNRDIGFDRNNLFYAWMEGDIAKNLETFKGRLMQQPGIESVTASSQLPISVGSSTSDVEWEGKSPDDRILFANMTVDFNFLQTMRMEMAEGRPFDSNLITDTSNYVLNERAAEKLGFVNGTAGHDLTLWEKKGKIIGVVKDFNFGSLHAAIEPLIMHVKPNELYCLLIRTKPNETEAALRSAEMLWKEYAPGYPIKYSFLNQDWEAYYKAEGQRGKIFNTLAVLSILISCLGLFGLSAFSAERRIKELGIRKVLGASVPGLIQLMNKEFTVLVIVAACIGCPFGWYLMTMWLQNYAYHVDVGYVTLVVAALVCLCIAVITVSYHSLRAASNNPVKSLRYE